MTLTAAQLRVEVGADTRPAESGLQSFNGKLNSITRNMGASGAVLSTAITAPLIGITTAGVNMAGDFEQSLNVLQQVTGATTGQMAAMQEQALQLGADTVFSAGEAAEGMLELGKAGFAAGAGALGVPRARALLTSWRERPTHPPRTSPTCHRVCGRRALSFTLPTNLSKTLQRVWRFSPTAGLQVVMLEPHSRTPLCG